MDFLSLVVPIALLIASSVWLYLYTQWKPKLHSPTTNAPSPPVVPGAWPVIGHLHLFSSRVPLFRTLAAMAEKNGPVFSFRLGVHPVVVVSDSEAIRECFTTNDKVLASRPTSTGAKILSYDSASFGFAPSGPYWREIRKLVVFELLSPKRLETLKHVRTYEIAATVNHINRIAKTSNKIVLSHLLEQLTLNIIVRMVSGKRYFRRTGGERDEGFTKVIKEFMYVSGEFSLSDVLPFWPLRLVDSVWKLRNVKRIMRELDAIVRNWIEEHVERRKERGVGDEQDFIDVMLSVIGEEGCYGHTRETIIKATIL
ncbi:Cytochrome P450 82C2 like, partial [Actinidia chinensis var. chinensis]